MHGLRLFALLVYTFGAFAYGALIVLWVRELGRIGWGVRTRPPDDKGLTHADLVNGALILVGFSWFAALIVQILLALGPGVLSWPLEMLVVLLAFAFPPLIVHITWVEARAERDDLHPAWGWVVPVAYAMSAAIPSACARSRPPARRSIVWRPPRAIGAPRAFSPARAPRTAWSRPERSSRSCRKTA